MLIRQYGHQWPRWKVTATGPDRSNASRVIKWPESSGRKKGGIASPDRGAASPALLSWRRLMSRSTAALNAGAWARTASANIDRRSASEASMSRHRSKTSSSGVAALAISLSSRRFKCVNQLFDSHAPAEIRIDKSRANDSVGRDNEGCGYRQCPGFVALAVRQRSAV